MGYTELNEAYISNTSLGVSHYAPRTHRHILTHHDVKNMADILKMTFSEAFFVTNFL